MASVRPGLMRRRREGPALHPYFGVHDMFSLGLAMILATLGSLPAASALPQAGTPHPEDVWDRVEGCWAGEGLLAGEATRFEMRWLSEGGLWVLMFNNQGETADDRFRAIGLYDPKNSTGFWQDSFGGRFDLAIRSGGEEIEVVWSRSDGEPVGSTTYTFPEDDSAHVVDMNLTGPEPIQFAEAAYRRVACA